MASSIDNVTSLDEGRTEQYIHVTSNLIKYCTLECNTIVIKTLRKSIQFFNIDLGLCKAFCENIRSVNAFIKLVHSSHSTDLRS